MPPFNVGFAQVEDRLRVVRRRLNLLTLQHALYVSGSLIALATAVVVGVALRGEGSVFGVAVWLAAGSVAAALIAAAMRVRQRWASVEEVVHFADRRAALDDRLATLVFDALPGKSSSLKGLLLEQVLAATPRWDIDTLVPRRVPRSIFALAGSLIALIFVAFFARPPGQPHELAGHNMPHSNHLADADEDIPPRSAGTRPQGTGQLGAGSGAMQLAGLAATRDHKAGAGAATSAREGAGGGAGLTTQRSDGAKVQEHSGTNSNGPAPAAVAAMPRPMTERFQSAIRGALGNEESGDTQREAAHNAPDAARRSAEQQKAGDPSSQPGTASMKHDAAKSNGQPPASTGTEPGAGAAAASGGRDGAAPEQLFGTMADARPANNGTQSVSIKLGTFATLAPSQAEPQRHAPPGGQPVLGSAGSAAPQPLADEQVADAPLQKAEVAPEHEALVRRIFTRDE
jgi:hypothetical protein